MRALALVLGGLLLTAAGAPYGERLPDKGQEARAHALFRQIRCVVCQNESIDDSEAGVAGDLRDLVRREIVAGRDDVQIKRALTDRYGDFVLLKPRFSLANALLWLAPLIVVLAGVGGLVLRRRSAGASDDDPLSAAEEARVAQITSPVTVPPQRRPTDTTASM